MVREHLAPIAGSFPGRKGVQIIVDLTSDDPARQLGVSCVIRSESPWKRSNAMNRHRYTIAFIITLATGLFPQANVSADHDPVVRFDLPAVVAARPADADPSDPTLVTIRLRLSSMIEAPQVPRIDQWLVRCQPRDNATSIADYAPRTEATSGLASPIQVKQTKEKTNAIGLSVDGSYGHAAHGKAGADLTTKNVSTLQFDRIAPKHTVIAAGTINRGRGVYFKLRWTAQQILDGEKSFQITLKVPSTWRGSLIDVAVVAQSQRKTFATWERESKTIGSANFVIAAYREGDLQAATIAVALSEAELALRSVAAEHDASTGVRSLSSLLRQVAMKFDLDSGKPVDSWAQRLILDLADPRLDKEICKLPMPIRLVVLDYVDVRDQFFALSGDAQRKVLVTKPAQSFWRRDRSAL
jgi:hypothetical protein